MSFEEIKNSLINLYINVKIRKLNEISIISNSSIQDEKNELNKLPIMDIINYISISIEILAEIKAQEKYEEKLKEDEKKEKYFNYENEEDVNGLKLYEGMLIKAESDIRNHIKVRNIINNYI